MPEDITVRPRSDSASPVTQAEASTEPPPLKAEKTKPDLSPFLIILAGGLLASFFMPWVKIFFGHPSGFDLQKLGGGHLAYWTIPFFSLFAIIAGLFKSSQRPIAHIAGIVPYLILFYCLKETGADLLRNLDYGAYVALGCGLALNVLAPFLK